MDGIQFKAIKEMRNEGKDNAVLHNEINTAHN